MCACTDGLARSTWTVPSARRLFICRSRWPDDVGGHGAIFVDLPVVRLLPGQITCRVPERSGTASYIFSRHEDDHIHSVSAKIRSRPECRMSKRRGERTRLGLMIFARSAKTGSSGLRRRKRRRVPRLLLGQPAACSYSHGFARDLALVSSARETAISSYQET